MCVVMLIGLELSKYSACALTIMTLIYVGYEVLTEGIMKNFLFWSTTRVLPIESRPTFRKTYHLHLHGQRISQAGNKQVQAEHRSYNSSLPLLWEPEILHICNAFTTFPLRVYFCGLSDI
jgi:hypothetical protein